MKNLRKEKDTTFVVPFPWRGAMRLERMPPHPEHIGDIMLAFRSIRMWKNVLPTGESLFAGIFSGRCGEEM